MSSDMRGFAARRFYRKEEKNMNKLATLVLAATAAMAGSAFAQSAPP
jgi:hypothetical protein